MSSPISLREVLALPALKEAGIEVMSGANRLDTPLRWVHVVDSSRSIQLLKGGELLLTTGLSFGSSPAYHRELVETWVEAGAVAVAVELGAQLPRIPQAIVERCRDFDFPLIAILREVRFVEITEAVHSAILRQQFDEVEQLQHINESFWGLMFNGAPPEQLVVHTSRQLERPVVLEDLNHRVVLYVEGHTLPSRLVGDWESKSRLWAAKTRQEGLIADPVTVVDPSDPEVSWTLIDIQAQGHHWGRLFVRDSHREDSKVRHVLHHAAMALAIERLSAAHPNSWTDLRERAGLERLLHNRFTTVAGQKAVLESAGFLTTGRQIVALEVRCAKPVDVDFVRRALMEIGGDVQCFVARSQEDSSRIVCAVSADRARRGLDDFVATFGEKLNSVQVAMEVAVCGNLEGPIDLGAALHRLSDSKPKIPAQGVRVWFADQDQVTGISHYLHNDVRIQNFAEELLAPLLIHDARHGTTLMETARALVAHPTSRSQVADQLHISRTALYSRIGTIERLLEIDAADGDSFFALSIAVRAYFGS